MNTLIHHTHEAAAAKAFSKQAPVFDALYGDDPVVVYKRMRVREHLEKFLQPGSHILELNAGTGEDAVYLAQKGHWVHATDISPVMQEKLSEKIKSTGLPGKVTQEICSFTELDNLQEPGPFDHIFSNFAGLNCTGRLDQVLASFPRLVKPGGYVTLVVLPRFCLWEFLLLFRGKFRTAFRRFSGKKGTPARVEGENFRCWYYDPSFIRKKLAGSFEPVALEGLCSLVPPSYIQHFATRHHRKYQWLVKREEKRKFSWPWRSIGDYFIITLKKKKV